MGATEQLAVVIVIVALAIVVLARRAIRLLSNRSTGSCGTGNCGSCPSRGESAGSHERFVPLDALGKPALPIRRE